MKYLIILIICFAFNVNSNAQATNKEPNNNQSINVDDNIKKIGIHLFKPNPPVANYVRAVKVGNLIFLSGHGPSNEKGESVTGKLGRDLNVDEGKAAARLAGIALLSSLKEEIGDLNKVKRIVKVLGMVNSTSDFTQHSQVINGFSNLMVEIFGDKGKHARAAVGMISLPGNIAVEIEMIVEIE